MMLQGLCQKKIRALLAFGVNEVARALEKDSAAFVLLCRFVDSVNGSLTPVPVEVLSRNGVHHKCRDVRPVRLVDHLATSARMREVPFLVLPKASAMLGQVFGFKRMACLAIKKTTTGQQDEGEDTSTVQQEGERRIQHRGQDVAGRLVLTMVEWVSAGAGMDQDAAATEAASIAVLESFCTLLVNKTDFINR